jgi:transposase
MRDASFFLHPQIEWQRRYEALRACFVERLPTKVVAERFGYTDGYVRFLKHQFRHGKLELVEARTERATRRRRVTAETRRKIRGWRQQRGSAVEISERLASEGIQLSARTVERILAEEGFPRLPRRRKREPVHVTGTAEQPEHPRVLRASDLESLRLSSPCAGLFLFAPLLGRLDLDGLVRAARLPDTRAIPARSYLLSLLTWKLLGPAHFSHLDGHPGDRVPGLFAGLNVLPARSALSSYASALDDGQLTRLQQALVVQAAPLGLYGGKAARVDLHEVPDGSGILEPLATTPSRRPRTASYLGVRDVESTRILYTATDTGNDDHADQVRSFCDFWQRVRGGAVPRLLFSARFLTYAELSDLDARGIRFLTPRRRGKNLIERATAQRGWQRLHLPATQHAFAAPLVHESALTLRGYRGRLRQLIVRASNGAPPLFLLSNDFTTSIEQLVGSFARSLHSERGVAASIEFFHPARPPSPTQVAPRCDVVLTMIADTLYSMLAGQLLGFEEAEASRLCRYFVQGGGDVEVQQGVVRVTCPRGDRATVLRAVPWQLLSEALPGVDGARLHLRFE